MTLLLHPAQAKNTWDGLCKWCYSWIWMYTYWSSCQCECSVESRKCEAVVVADMKGKKLKAQTVRYTTVSFFDLNAIPNNVTCISIQDSGCPAAPEGFAPSKELQQLQVSQFSSLRSRMCQHLARLKQEGIPPTSLSHLVSCIYLYFVNLLYIVYNFVTACWRQGKRVVFILLWRWQFSWNTTSSLNNFITQSSKKDLPTWKCITCNLCNFSWCSSWWKHCWSIMSNGWKRPVLRSKGANGSTLYWPSWRNR